MPISVGAAPAIIGACAAAAIFPRSRNKADVNRRVVEMVVADQAPEGMAAERTELLFVEGLEQRALVPFGVGIEAQVTVELLLRNIHDLQLQGRVGFGIVDDVVQAAPSALDLLECLVVQDLVDLSGKLLVEPRDHLVDRVEHVVLDQARVGERLLDQRVDGVLDFRRRSLAARLETLFEQAGKVLGFLDRDAAGRGLVRCKFGSHCLASAVVSLPYVAVYALSSSAPSAGLAAMAASRRSFSACISCGSASSFLS